MKKTILFCLFLKVNFVPFAPCFLTAQTLPVQTVTLFKNGQSLVTKGGKVKVVNGKYRTHDLPDALFGSYWVSSPANDLASVFSKQDTLHPAQVTRKQLLTDNLSLLKSNMDQQIKIWKQASMDAQPTEIEGVLMDVLGPDSSANSINIIMCTVDSQWICFPVSQIQQITFPKKPKIPSVTISNNTLTKQYDAYDYHNTRSKPLQRTLEVNFKTPKKEEQIVDILYLVNNLGWTPIYQIVLNDSGKSFLYLRAEIANDAEDLSNAALRLAVGMPNFTFAQSSDWMMNFLNLWGKNNNYLYAQYSQSALSTAQALNASNYGTANPVGTGVGELIETNKAEDFFFYNIRVSNFPKNSRYQYPIFDAEIVPEHVYEYRLKGAGPLMLNDPYQTNSDPNEILNMVSHFIEFKNQTQYPFTTGAANILSETQGTIFPISQDKLPYTPPGAKCKVRIANSPEIKVSHSEKQMDRRPYEYRYDSYNYIEHTLEGEISIVNHKDSIVKVRIHRTIEGTPLTSLLNWTLKQEHATLRVNPMYEVMWEIDLNPREEKKWKYQYKVLVR